MILVTVGTHHQSFERLVCAMDELAGDLDEQVIIQYGASMHVLRHALGFSWTTSEEMEQLTSQARAVVTHAAAGAIILALKMAKPLVVTPRLRMMREVIDDHQEQLAKILASDGKAIALFELTPLTLRLGIEQATQLKFHTTQANMLKQALRVRLRSWEGQY
ncbi:MAG: hypothetical protein JSV61_04930 [Anaerolineales bacterium]|nr:MAG: hypothetical protein JSV61_04930 [Anaerolineales bacterium]